MREENHPSGIKRVKFALEKKKSYRVVVNLDRVDQWIEIGVWGLGWCVMSSCR